MEVIVSFAYAINLRLDFILFTYSLITIHLVDLMFSLI